jgi:enamine deaminase RidA (YjgF/YER057c/UK114 family)
MARRIVRVDGIAPIVRGYPSAVVADGLVFVSGQRGGRSDMTPDLAALPRAFQDAFACTTLSDEAAFAMDGWTAHQNLDRVIRAAGSDPSHVLRLHIWLRDKRVFPVYERIRMAWQKVPAPSSCLGVTNVPGRFGRAAGIEALAVVPGENPLLPGRATVRTFDDKEFPAAAFYSQAVRCGPLVFLAGHIPIETNKPGHPVISGFADIPPEGRVFATGRSHPDSRQGPIMAQTWFTYEKIRENLAAQGLGLDAIKHIGIMLQDVRDFDAFQRVHRHFFPEQSPALVIAGFDEVGHRGTRIEIEPTALDPSANVRCRNIDWPCPAPFAGPAGVQLGNLCLFAGMLGLNGAGRLVRGAHDLDDPVGRRVADDLARHETAPGFAAQCWAAWSLLKTVAGQMDMPLDRLTKTTVYLRHAADLAIYEEIREAFLSSIGADLPAAEFVGVPAPGPVAAAQVQIEATGVRA